MALERPVRIAMLLIAVLTIITKCEQTDEHYSAVVCPDDFSIWGG